MNFKQQLFWIIITYLFSTQAHSAIATTLHHLQNNQEITLLADVGFGDPVMYPLPKRLQKRIDSSTLLIETEVGNTQPGVHLQRAILQSREDQLKSVITRSTWDNLQHWLKQRQNQPGIHLISSVTPHWALALISNSNLQNRAGYSITHHLIAQDPKPTAIFTAQEQLDWFLKFDNTALDSLINQAVQETEDLYQRIIHAWKNADNKAMKSIIDTITSGKEGHHIQTNYDDLNQQIAQRLTLLPPGQHVAAINIVSYLGDNNVVNKLIEAGFQIKE